MQTKIERIIIYTDLEVRDRHVAENIKKRLKRIFKTKDGETEVLMHIVETCDAK